MLCLPLLVILLTQVTHPIRTAYVTASPSFADRLDRIYEKIERLTPGAPPDSTHAPQTNQWDTKLQKFKALSPESVFLSDDDEELLSAIQTWGLTADQLGGVAKDLQRMRDEGEEDRTMELTDPYYTDMDDNDEDYGDYRNDGKEDEDDEDPETSSAAPHPPAGVTPSAYTRNDHPFQNIVVAMDPIAATHERPIILEESDLTAADRISLRTLAIQRMHEVVKASKCLVPQARWMLVRQLAPAADTQYLPPCIQLHRCAPDSGCCSKDGEICAPSAGNFIKVPFLLQKASRGKDLFPVRMLFYNHTQCACVSRESYHTRDQQFQNLVFHSEERQNDWRPAPIQVRTVQPLSEEDVTAPPQMRRCTCPILFLANVSDSGSCTCGCEWRDLSRRRQCLLFSRGKEHLALKDRVCIAERNCAPPACEYGVYNTSDGKCPVRKFRRIRYHVRPRHDKNVV